MSGIRGQDHATPCSNSAASSALALSTTPSPWSLLKYDTDKGGYAVPLEKEQLSDAPRYQRDMRPVYDEAYGRSVYEHYGMPWL